MSEQRLQGIWLKGVEKFPLVIEAETHSMEDQQVSVSFRVNGRHAFWPRLKMAFRYWWWIASGRLQFAILSKCEPRS